MTANEAIALRAMLRGTLNLHTLEPLLSQRIGDGAREDRRLRRRLEVASATLAALHDEGLAKCVDVCKRVRLYDITAAGREKIARHNWHAAKEADR
jgi:hypothetical protein